MRKFWKRSRSPNELEDELRARRSEAPADLVRTLASRVRGTERRARPRFRMSPAYGVAILAVAVLIAAGGVGVIQSAGSGLGHLAGRLASSSHETVVGGNAGTAQYKGKCGRPPRKARCVISIHSTSVTEPKTKGCAGHAAFPVTMAIASDEKMSVKYKTKNGTAKGSDPDYGVKTGRITFKPGHKRKTIRINVCHDKGTKNEYFFVKLFQPSAGAVIGGKNPAKATIKQ